MNRTIEIRAEDGAVRLFAAGETCALHIPNGCSMAIGKVSPLVKGRWAQLTRAARCAPRYR